MTNEEVETVLKNAYPEADFKVKGDGRHFNIAANGAIFNGLSRLKQHQLLNAVLNPFLENGSVHAVIYQINPK